MHNREALVAPSDQCGLSVHTADNKDQPFFLIKASQTPYSKPSATRMHYPKKKENNKEKKLHKTKPN
jgi:hypothetical protein